MTEVWIRSGQTGPLGNPGVVRREDGDGWAFLHNPQTGSTFGLSPAGLPIWKCLGGRHRVLGVTSSFVTQWV